MIAVVTIIAVIVFLLLIWALVAILLYARKRLVPEGNVTIKINQEHIIEQERGVSLLKHYRIRKSLSLQHAEVGVLADSVEELSLKGAAMCYQRNKDTSVEKSKRNTTDSFVR